MDGRLLTERINLLGPWLRARHGCDVVKIPLDARLGCPHRRNATGDGGCSFCPPSGAGAGDEGLTVSEQLAQGLVRLQGRKRPTKALAYFQAYTSTNASKAHLAELYGQAVDNEGVAGVIISTRPDCLDDERWELLSAVNAQSDMWLELGLQSAHDQSLAAMGRGHDVACFDRAVDQAHARGIKVVAHVILGLPDEDLTHTNATARHLASLEVWGVKLHNLMILRGARLAYEYEQGQVACWTRPEFVRAVAEFLARLNPNTLVHRLAADPGGDELLAPSWAENKDATLSALAELMVTENLEQGSRYP